MEGARNLGGVGCDAARTDRVAIVSSLLKNKKRFARLGYLLYKVSDQLENLFFIKSNQLAVPVVTKQIRQNLNWQSPYRTTVAIAISAVDSSRKVPVILTRSSALPPDLPLAPINAVRHSDG